MHRSNKDIATYRSSKFVSTERVFEDEDFALIVVVNYITAVVDKIKPLTFAVDPIGVEETLGALVLYINMSFVDAASF